MDEFYSPRDVAYRAKEEAAVDLARERRRMEGESISVAVDAMTMDAVERYWRDDPLRDLGYQTATASIP